ncbi:unnamed protein product, partial [Anisakis simplex]|uniref:Abnormal cell migration protein 10 (inferred by orthology to a C. elegans protein) n=1 Tax=Anisakis simplex TaxID=6269 RepID=A0A0M3K4M7_ANISI
ASPNQSSSGCSTNVDNTTITTSGSGTTSAVFPQHQQQQQKQLSASEIKAAKIREALEKMREADIKKLYVKFFLDDGTSTVSILVDERWKVADVMKHIADKAKVTLTQQHAIVEEYPELFIKRIYEDNEYLVENIMMWTLNSQNKLYFTRRPDKYDFMDRPEEYLLTERNIDVINKGPPSPDTKRRIVKEFFENDSVQPPEIEGWLLLKSDGKKSWKKHFFVLRSSGLYYCTKGKSRSSKDLQCLMTLQTNQHPKIQVKASKYIKYVCAEDAVTFHKWMVALRIAKNGRQLYDNYWDWRRRLENPTVQPMKVDIPQVSAPECHRLSTIELRKNQMSRQDPVPLLNLNRDLKSPASMSSRRSTTSTINNDTCSSSHNSIVFDQSDDIMTGTIKRAPCDIQQIQTRRQSSQAEMYTGSGSGSTSVNSAPDVTADSDSDEEQFPPPPPTVLPNSYHDEASAHKIPSSGVYQPTAISDVALLANRVNNNNNNIDNHNQINATAMYASSIKQSHVPIPPTKPNLPNANFKKTYSESKVNGMPSTAPVMKSAVTPKKMPPPPPPKRSDTTRLQHPTATADALHSELEMVMARRLQRIEQH